MTFVVIALGWIFAALLLAVPVGRLLRDDSD